MFLKLQRLRFGAAVLVFATALCRSALAAPTPIPDQKPNLGPVAYMVGTWTCVYSPGGGGPTHPLTTEYSYALDGRWIRAHYVSPPFDTTRAYPVLFDSYLGYDRSRGQWVQLGFGNTGDYAISYASQRTDGSLAFTGTIVFSGTRIVRHWVVTKVSNTEMRITGSDPGATSVDRCVKVDR